METPTLADSICALRHLTKTAPDPRVRRRARAVLLMTEGASWSRRLAVQDGPAPRSGLALALPGARPSGAPR